MKQNKIPTAKEFIPDDNYHFVETHTGNQETCILKADIPQIMIEFTKLHVQAALKEAADKAEIKDIMVPNCDDHTSYWGTCGSCGKYDNPDILVGSKIDKNSILNSYPLENIK